jgi:hypothetical protein
MLILTRKRAYFIAKFRILLKIAIKWYRIKGIFCNCQIDYPDKNREFLVKIEESIFKKEWNLSNLGNNAFDIFKIVTFMAR